QRRGAGMGLPLARLCLRSWRDRLFAHPYPGRERRDGDADGGRPVRAAVARRNRGRAGVWREPGARASLPRCVGGGAVPPLPRLRGSAAGALLGDQPDPEDTAAGYLPALRADNSPQRHRGTENSTIIRRDGQDGHDIGKGMSGAFDLAVIGSGFGGSLTAMVARRLGLSVLLLERGMHPRFAIGESSS